jgi:anthraniloyl-CoA monooxygenase
MRPLKILVAGGGPAGLSFARLMAGSNSSHEITVFERGDPERMPGWGITLRSQALEFLGLNRRIAVEFLDGRALLDNGQVVIDLPNPPDMCLATFSRAALIQALAVSCSELGVKLRYEADASALPGSVLDGYDLVVAADGAHSALRLRFAEFFRPSITLGRNRYIWLGAAVPFHKLTILLRHQDTTMLGWAYKFTSELSTFILECTQKSYDRLGLSEMSPDDLRETIAKTFASELGGQRVLSIGCARLQPYPVISCERLFHRNVVLIGDAAHTTHFSQGFGTMFAFEDALALQATLRRSTDIPQALSQYSAVQKPRTAGFQATASASMLWSENLLDAAEIGDRAVVRALIESRWPANTITASPLDQMSFSADDI